MTPINFDYFSILLIMLLFKLAKTRHISRKTFIYFRNMEDHEKRIAELEDKNSELAKEILLNESAVYETETQIDNLDTDLIRHPRIQQYISQLNLLIKRIKTKNNRYKKEIFQNEFEIKKLRENE